MPFNLVCPSSRGLSLALSRRLLQVSPYPLVATARRDLEGIKAEILRGLEGVDEGRVTVLKVDVTDELTIAAAASSIRDLHPNQHLHYAFTTPGILHPERSPSDLDATKILQTLTTNVLGPLLLIKHFTPFLPSRSSPPEGGGPAVYACITARVGSISDNRLGGWYSYRASKAGLNQVVKTLDIHLKRVCRERAVAVALHPGTVKTGLSKDFWGGVEEGKLFTPEFAAERLVDVVRGVGEKERGLMWDWKGEKVEW